MDDLSKKTLEKIKKEHISPKPKWKLQIKDISIWSFLGIFIVLAVLSFSAITFLMADTDWGIAKNLNRSFLRHVIMSFPFIWIILFIIFIMFSVYEFKNTKKGYKYNFSLIVGVALIIISVLGFALFSSGMGKKFNQRMINKFPFSKFSQNKGEVWMQPKKGLLAGEILEIINRDKIILKDFNDMEWEVYLENAFLKSKNMIKEGGKIKVVGQKKNENIFIAEKVWAWGINMQIERKNIKMRIN